MAVVVDPDDDVPPVMIQQRHDRTHDGLAVLRGAERLVLELLALRFAVPAGVHHGQTSDRASPRSSSNSGSKWIS